MRLAFFGKRPDIFGKNTFKNKMPFVGDRLTKYYC